MRRFVLSCVAATLISQLCTVEPVLAQATVSGQVVDPQGAPVANALVTVSPPAPPRTTRTSISGEFQSTERPGRAGDAAGRGAGLRDGAPGRDDHGGRRLGHVDVAGRRPARGGERHGNRSGRPDAGQRRRVAPRAERARHTRKRPDPRRRVDPNARRRHPRRRDNPRGWRDDRRRIPGTAAARVAARGFGGVGSVMQLFDGDQLLVGAGTVTFPFDPWTVERVEVLSGPASVMLRHRRHRRRRQRRAAAAESVLPRALGPARRAVRSTRGAAPIDTTGPDRLPHLVSRRRQRQPHERLDRSWRLEQHGRRRVASPRAVAVADAHRCRRTTGVRRRTPYFGTPIDQRRGRRVTCGTSTTTSRDADIWYRDNWTQARSSGGRSPNARVRRASSF